MCESILVVEDNDDLLLLFRLALEAVGYQVTTVNNGQDALDLVNTIQPHLVLMDIMMPKVSGLQVARQIKEQFNHQSLPILLVSGVDRLQNEQLINSKANGIIYKPFDLGDLTTRVQDLIGNCQLTCDRQEQLVKERQTV